MAKIKVTNRNIANPFQKMSVVSDFLALVGDDRTGSGVSFDSSLLYTDYCFVCILFCLYVCLCTYMLIEV